MDNLKDVVLLIMCIADAPAIRDHKLYSVYMDAREIFFCNTDFTKVAEALECEIKEAPRDSDMYNIELYFYFQGWKLYTIGNKEGQNAEV